MSKDSIYDDEFWSGIKNKKLSENQIDDINITRKSQFNYFKTYFKGKKCVDIGCGMGYSIRILEKHGLSVDGLEPDSECVKYVNSWIKNGVCKQGFFNDIQSDVQYNIIWLSHVLEHIEDPLSFLNKCYEMINDDGTACIMVPDCTNPKMLTLSKQNKYHLHHFSRDELLALCNRSRFSVVEIQSFKEMNVSTRRFQKLLHKIGITFLSELLEPFYPFQKTNSNDGYELRVVLRKTREKHSC